jgi:hypothetical protein
MSDITVGKIPVRPTKQAWVGWHTVLGRELAGHVLRQAREFGFVDLYSMFRRLG